MKKSLLTTLVAASLAQGVWSVAHAEAPAQKQFYLYPHFNYYDYDDINGASIDNDHRFGLAIGARFNPNLGLELSWDNIRSQSSGADVDSTLWQLNGVYTFNTDSNWQPLLLLGIGDVSHDFSTTPAKTEDGTSLDLGAGLNYVFNDIFALRGDIRYVHTIDYSANDLMATLGFTIGFGPTLGASEMTDTDGDGVADDMDQCAGTPVGAKVDANGCEIDSDKDGIADSLDQCPSTAENAPVDSKGCALDSDADGVADYMDKCNDTPEGALVDESGCPKVLKEDVSITMNLSFDTNKAEIKPEFREQIAKVAAFMKQYPQTTVVFEGYSDSMGDAGYNKQLSERRARAVADALVNDYGIAADRVSAVGYGEENPVADNSTPEGRKANRRVVANITATVEKK